MTDGYDCYPNALAERWKPSSCCLVPKYFAEAIRMVCASVQIYNNGWPHLSVKYKTPYAERRASRG
ncbi:hypothetical protein JJQ97_13320 [Pseudomonas syringae]|nr:hypothetical protein JJQ97_13320 [Pseudomonas syringae]